MKVKALSTFMVSGKTMKEGEVFTIDDVLGAQLLHMGRVEEIKGKGAAVDTQPKNRDGAPDDTRDDGAKDGKSGKKK